METLQWTVDVAPDALGFATIRVADGTCYGATDRQPVATVYALEHARLIAAAPELLQALDLVNVDKDGDGFICAEGMAQVRAAIAKARGQ